MDREYDYEIRREIAHVKEFKKLKNQANMLIKYCNQKIKSNINEMKKFDDNKTSSQKKSLPSKLKLKLRLNSDFNSNHYSNRLSDSSSHLQKLQTPIALSSSDKVHLLRSESYSKNLRKILLIYNNPSESIPGIYHKNSRFDNFDHQLKIMPSPIKFKSVLFKDQHSNRSKSLMKFDSLKNGFVYKKYHNIINSKLLTPLKGSDSELMNSFTPLRGICIGSGKNSKVELKEEINPPFQTTIKHDKSISKYNKSDSSFFPYQYSQIYSSSNHHRYSKLQTEETFKSRQCKKFKSYLPTDKLLNCIKKYKLPSIGLINNPFKVPKILSSQLQV